MFTSESVTSGHPDKLCDYISDSILDACIAADPFARVAVEVLVKGLDKVVHDSISSYIVIAGEVSIDADVKIEYEKIARQCCIEIGYCDVDLGLDASDLDSCHVEVLVSEQSKEIGQGVDDDRGKFQGQGAGDQGIMFGYASDESENFKELKGSYMPLPILLAQKITSEMTRLRMDGELNWAGPDGKSQVTVEYDGDVPKRVHTVVIAVQHRDMIGSKFDNEQDENEFIRKEIKEKIIDKIIPKDLKISGLKIIVNGTGRFCKGGPHADAGLTGRKIVVDTYGGRGRHGGGAFSGKDPTKVDRSAAYAARKAAKHVVASGLAKECEIQLAYSIGVSEPISVNLNVETYGSSKIKNESIKKIIENHFDFAPASIIDDLNLRKPIYSVTASGGHFGRIYSDGQFTWEKIDKRMIKKLGEYQIE